MAESDPLQVQRNLSADPQASVIYFDEVPTFHSYNGIVGITLSNFVQGTDDGKLTTVQVVAAYLRCNLVAAERLRGALDNALLLARGRPEQSVDPVN